MRRIRRWIRALRSAEVQPPQDYWSERARRFGTRAVYNLGHPPEALETIDKKQKALLLPLLKDQLGGDEQRLLDFGCGTGRFSGALAEATRCEVTAVDATKELLVLAPPHPRVTYVEARGSALPFPDEHFEVVWICLVLGALRGQELHRTLAEVQRVAKPDALLFLVENTSEKLDAGSWAFRTVAEYRSMLYSFALIHISDYEDLGERISILAGRKLT